ncbi:helix-turn-helix domain-containing protein [Streptomyces sp. AC563]|uniref:helix-turn-helix transcriptional regulator n=1 Tax=Streptomyces buecherae TaxID=2763006 RepID=UPI00164DDABD|nr:helix-turn-helix domain-containing protein [Streptomyces buecherae]
MSVKQVAELLNVSTSWIYKNAVHCGLPLYKFGSGRNAKIQINVSEIQAWIEQQKIDHA